MIDPITSLHLISVDLLKLIAYKKSQNLIREVEILQNFYDHALSICNSASEELHSGKLTLICEHYKAKILEAELKQIYNDVFKRDSKFAKQLITNSVIPTKKQLSEEVIIKS